MNEELKEQFWQLACELEPENLSRDGELNVGQVAKRRRELMLEWGALERQAKRTVTSTEVWSWDPVASQNLDE